MSDVPQELVDLVLDHLHNDRPALLSASLVCRSWYASTRHHLYRRVVFFIGLTIPPFEEQTIRSFERIALLQQILQEKPELAKYIREVVITGANAHRCSGWRQIEPVVTAILARLNRVSTLELRDVHWDHLAPKCQMAMVSIFRNFCLNKVEFYNVSGSLSDIFSLISFAKTLKSLRTSFTPANHILTDVQNYPGPDEVVKCPPGQISLQFLEIGSTSKFLGWVMWLLDPYCPIAITELRHLRLTHVTDVPLCGQLLRAVGRHLQVLELWAPTSREPKRVGDDISMSWMPAVQVFTIKGLMFTQAVCSIPCLVDIFTVTVPHDLEELHFLIDTDNSRRNSLNWDSWTTLDDLLCSGMYDSLRIVDIVLCFNQFSTKTMDVMQFQRTMPRLYERGILSISIG
ncbi:hypothetical protein AMATHDRAFT_63651 [Amanita thiersii Skay4041]|uniref:F-box domain-containing protein n=1 Tax=Amanita thiersii Skay4041 TaxID=703135 RepID=A0A2A9NLL7_9AGAR|nr:hypothetical protein AMATHDRAFT_63651 [Amanita thiersii Skay4041]